MFITTSKIDNIEQMTPEYASDLKKDLLTKTIPINDIKNIVNNNIGINTPPETLLAQLVTKKKSE